jgi:cobalamin biosynthesis protein CbiD
MCGGIRLPGAFQQIISLGTRAKLRSLAAGIFREHREAVFQ